MNTKKTFTVSIEEKLCKSIDVEASTMEEAEEMVIEMYNNGDFVLTGDDVGTDAEIMVEEEATGQSTDWHMFGY